MKYPIFASVVILSLLLMYEIHKHRNKEEKYYQSLLDREVEANSTRRKPLNDLEYVSVPLDTLPMDILPDDEKVSEYHSTLKELSETKIVNLTGISNTDLKLKYGAPNIDILIRYDHSYTMLVRTLYEWGEYLYEKGYTEETKTILEYAVSIRTDVSGTYSLLAKIYDSEGNTDKIKELIPAASEINSLMKDSIISNLESYILPDLSGLE